MMRFAVVEIGDPDIDRHAARSVRGGQRVAVIHFAIGGVVAIEGRPVPGGDAGLVIVRLLARIVPDIVDLIGLADLVDPGIGRNRDGMVLGRLGGGGAGVVLQEARNKVVAAAKSRFAASRIGIRPRVAARR